jgi:hypothetical protein
LTLAVSGCGGSARTTGRSTTATGVSTTATGPSAPPTTTGPTPPTPSASGGPIRPTSTATAKFIGQADQICALANRALLGPQAKVNAALKAEQTKGTAAHRNALAQAVRDESAVAGAELGRLRRLRPPSGDGLAFGKYVGAVAAQVGLINQLAAAVAADDGAALTAIGSRLTAGKATVDAIASIYGFKVCGNSTS